MYYIFAGVRFANYVSLWCVSCLRLFVVRYVCLSQVTLGLVVVFMSCCRMIVVLFGAVGVCVLWVVCFVLSRFVGGFVSFLFLFEGFALRFACMVYLCVAWIGFACRVVVEYLFW